MEPEVKNSRGVYRDEATALVAAAAQAPPPRSTPVAPLQLPRIKEKTRAPLRPPSALNDNLVAKAPPSAPRRSPVQLAARLFIAPWYLAVAAAAVLVHVVFLKSLLGL